ncbi:MAG TPA: LacI family transcriptional regulator [Epulopiscium sp.]|jgi:LacI family transcriptional regulator|nr:LacI family transcriptional regulator [Candidatus Epulonipiscium sp.]
MSIIKEVAAEAGVSVMTVYNVINGNYSKVSEKKIKLILKLLEEKNYVPNLTAKSLAIKSTKIIGIIVPVGDDDYNFFKDPYLSELIGVIEHLLRKKGYYAMVRSVIHAADISTLLKTWNMDGAIFLLPYYDHIAHQILAQNDLPMVFLDSYSDNPDIFSVGIDDYKGGYIATKYLVSLGHTRIAFAGSIGEDGVKCVVNQRFKGYKDALREANIEFHESFVYPFAPVYDMGIVAGREISKRKGEITAVLATADVMAIGIMEGARLNGYLLPNDLSIVGFDNIEASIFCSPKLTTVSQNIPKKAECAIDLLMKQINDEPTPEKRPVLDVEIIERQSAIPLR